MHWSKEILVVALFEALIAQAESHLTEPTAASRPTVLEEKALPPMPKNSAKASDRGDVANANFIHVIYLADSTPVKGDAKWAFDTCNDLGHRLPNIDELTEMVEKHKTAVLDTFKNTCLWSTSPDSSAKARSQIYSYNLPGVGWGDNDFKGCGAICLKPKDVFADMIAMCPTGAMDYCKANETDITDCSGKRCRAGFRCICGDFAMAFQRCAQRKLGMRVRKLTSWCAKEGQKDKDHHATNIIQIDPTGFAGKRYCWVEPQGIRAGAKKNDFSCCWVQKDGEPTLPAHCQKRLCDEGWTTHTKVRPDDYSFYDDDFTDNDQCTTHFQYKTGIEAKYLSK